VTIAGAVPGMEVAFFASNSLQGSGQDKTTSYEMLSVDEDYIKTFGLSLLAGRPFQKGFGNEREVS